MRRCQALLLKLILACLTQSVSGYAARFEVWNTLANDIKLVDDYSLLLENQIRNREFYHYFYYYHFQFMLEKKFNDHWRGALGYREIVERGERTWQGFSQPQADLTYSTDIKKWKFSNRNRLEYRFTPHGRPDMATYRLRFRFVAPFTWTCLNLTPYFSNEFFFEKRQGYRQNRLQAGFEIPLTETVKGGIYYLWRTVKAQPKWVNTNVLELDLSFPF